MPTPRTTGAVAVLVLAALLAPLVPVEAGPGPLPVELDPDFTETPWGYLRKDYAPPADVRHAILFMDGYLGASTPDDILSSSTPVPVPAEPNAYFRARDGALLAVRFFNEFEVLPPGYVLVWVSIRGTGCSGGTFDLFDRTHAYDGYELVEWLATLPWFHADVGLYGASYSGITALLVASTQPPSLKVVSANMVLGDLYRDIAYPGGVPNINFPGTWTVAYRPLLDHLAVGGGLKSDDRICAWNVASRQPGYPTDHAGFGMYTRRVDDPMYQVRSPSNWAHLIEVPIMIGGAFQDEQTGPRATLEVWSKLVNAPAKKLVMSNGVHSTALDNSLSRSVPWFEHFLKGVPNGVVDEPRVEVLFEKRGSFRTGSGRVSASLHASDFPLLDTAWTRFFLHGDGALSTDAPAPDDATRAYAYGSQRQSWAYQQPTFGAPVTTSEGPDKLVYRTEPLASASTVLGPITVTLRASTTSTDTDFFVWLADVAPDGSTTYLARGMLRASHRALDERTTWRNDAGDVIRPGHPHVNPQPVVPGEVNEYLLEVFPVGHHFRAGHRIQVEVTAPPLVDGIWGYAPVGTPGVNLVHPGSSVLLPLVSLEGPVAPWPGCGAPIGYRCVR